MQTMQTRSYTALLNAQSIHTPKFSFTGQKIVAKIVYVVDGDTVDVVFKPDGSDNFYKFRCRLNGINTPETKGIERPLGLIVKQYVKNDLLDKIVLLRLYDFDNFGRIIADIHIELARNDTVEFINYNEHLVYMKYACIYEYRKQHIWDII